MSQNINTVVVTGGCGYIGSHIARAFKYANPSIKVYTIDRVKRAHTLKYIDGFLFDDFVGDFATQQIKSLQPDVIVHCAGTSLVGPSMLNPSEYYDNNVIKTAKLLDFIAKLDKKPNIIFSSSASVYGKPELLPIPENHKLCPISPYGNTKLIVEMMLKDYHRAYNINSTCFRYFNAAGAWPESYDLGQEPNATHIIARALESSLSGTEFTVYGNDYNTADGTCIRDYIHVMDIADAHLKAADYMCSNSGSHTFNLGTNTGTSNQQIVDFIKKKYGFTSIKYGSSRPGDPAELIADATKANTILKWKPVHSKINMIINDAHRWYAKLD